MLLLLNLKLNSSIIMIDNDDNNDINPKKIEMVDNEELEDLNDNKVSNSQNENIWQLEKKFIPIKNEISNCNKILKKTNTFHFETPKDKIKINNNTSSLLSFFPSSPTSPVYAVLNEKNEYQVLWSPSMETPTLKRISSRNSLNKVHSNLVSPENIEKNDFKKYKSKSLISFPTNTPIELEKCQFDTTSVLINKNTPKNNLIYDNSNLTTPDSAEPNKITRKTTSRVSEQSSIFKNAFSDNIYLSSPMISPDDINNDNIRIPNNFRKLFYSNNKENLNRKSNSANKNIENGVNLKISNDNITTKNKNEFIENIKQGKSIEKDLNSNNKENAKDSSNKLNT